MADSSAAQLAPEQDSPSVMADPGRKVMAAQSEAAPQAESPVRKSPPKNGIIICDSAAEFAKKRLAKRGTPDAAIRLGVKGGSCSGYSYVIQYEDKPPRERDYVYEKNGVQFIVDKKSFLFLAGSTLKFENTLMFQGFKFENPQETQKCGCGHSFNVR